MKYKNIIKLIVVFLISSFSVSATNYYVSSSTGSDSNPGTISQPFASISKVNSVIVAGDNVNFMRGDTFYGTLIPNSSTHIYGAYGTGVNPIITGFTTVTGWTNLGSNIWEATVPSGLATCNMVSINGVNTAMGRYPNAGTTNDGYLQAGLTSTTTKMVNSANITGTPNWTGAEILIRHQDWSSNRGTITANTDSNLTYTSGSTYAFSSNHGFFIENDVRTLDVQNEWCYYDASGVKKLRIYSTTSPINVQAATLTTLVDMTYTSGTAKTGISFIGINFTGCNGTLFKNFYANYTTIDSCTLSFAGISGIEYGNTTSHLTVQNSSISDCAMVGIYETYYINVDNVTLKNNTLKRIGINAGMIAPISALYDGGNSSIGIIGGSINYTVYGNYLDSIGYNGIGLRQNQNNTLVRKNTVLKGGMVKNDGGDIYNGGQRGLPAATNVIIDSNICLNLAPIGGGASAGSGAITPHWRGIYLDATSASVQVLNNFIINRTEGIYMSHAVDCIIQNNQIYGGGDAPSYTGMINVIDAFTGYQGTRRNRIVNNVLVADSTSSVFYSSYNTFGTLDSIGRLDSNFYFNLIPSTYYAAVSGSLNARYISFSAWKTAHPVYDANSQYISGGVVPTPYYNTTKISSTINFSGLSKKDGFGNVFNNSYSLLPNQGVLLFANGSALSTTYYVSSSTGNDGNPGTSIGTAWKTITKINGATFSSGDSILFKRGETWAGVTLVPPIGNLHYGCYGTGANPVITGFVTISAWTSLGSNKYSATVAGSPASLSMVTLGDSIQPMGRWPNISAGNGGYRTYTGNVYNTSITDATLTGSPNWTGAEVVFKPRDYIVRRAAITSHSTTTLNFTMPNPGISYVNGMGYFIQNSLATLDENGEWYYDGSGTITMYYTSTPPSIQVATLNNLMYSVNGPGGSIKSNLSFENIDFVGCTKTALTFTWANNLKVNNCSIKYAGDNGIELRYTANALITNNLIKDINDIGVFGFDNSVYTYNVQHNNNTLKRIGLYTGMYPVDISLVGESSPGCGIIMNNKNETAYGNNLDSIGYCGIIFTKYDSLSIRRNVIKNFTSTKNDGGGIYHSAITIGTDAIPNSVLLDSNIVSKSSGNAAYGTLDATNPHTRGIYLDAQSTHLNVLSNTVSDCYEGIYISSAKYNTLLYNKIFNCGISSPISSGAISSANANLTSYQTSNNRISSNVVVTNSSTSRMFYVYNPFSSPSYVDSIGVIDSNVYINQNSVTPIFRINAPISETFATPALWSAAHPYDSHSTYITTSGWNLFKNETNSVVVTSLGGFNYSDILGVNYPNTITLQPGASAILLKGTAINTYYVSSSTGNDGNPGTISSPFASISKVNSTIIAGDSVKFMRGDTFHGTITPSSSTHFYGAYGTGAKPIITGFTTISSGWTNEGGGIYSKVISSAAQTNMVTIDGVQYGMGRTPDASYNTYTAYSTNTSITDPTLTGTPNWTGAEAVVRKDDYTLERCLITSQSTTILNLGAGTSHTGNNNYGYFFQNALSTVTTYGEWYHDYSGTGKLYVYFGGGGPASHTVNVATVNYLISDNTYDYITVDNLDIRGSIDNAVFFQYNNDYCAIQNCNISFAGSNGIQFLDPNTGQSIVNNSVSNCNSTGIVSDAANTDISYNTITNIGLIAGQTKVGGGYAGIYSTSRNGTITNNTIKNIGYNGIILRFADASTTQYNRIDSSCLILDDGAGIYTSSVDAGVRIIDHNVISNVIGGVLGKPSGTGSSSCGIYLDENSSNCVVTNNSISLTGYAGIKLHKASSNTIKYNTTYDCQTGIAYEDYVGNQIRSNVIKGNIIFSKTSIQRSAFVYTLNNDVNLFATYDSNYYARPIAQTTPFYLRTGSLSYVNYSLSQWQALTTQEAHSLPSPMTITNINQLLYVTNPSATSTSVGLGGFNYSDTKGVNYPGTITLQPYTSAVLIKGSSITPTGTSGLFMMNLRNP